jgi:hypothetical protein
MLTFLIHSRTAWNDYFTGNPTTLQPKEYSGTAQTLSGTNIHVLNCLFRSITSSSDGGALYCNSVTYLLVESSSFFSCTTSSDDGGAICFSNGNGQSVFYKVCGYDCYSTYTSGTSFGQFSYNCLNNAASSKNYINYSTIARCGIDNSYAHYVICHHYGTHLYPSVNMSMNKCYGRTGIYCCPYGGSNSATCSISFSSFSDNIATGYTCIQLWTTGVLYEIKSCNILRNTQGSLGSQGTIYTAGNLIIRDSCILENTATYIFRQGSSSYTITLSNCTVDSTSNNGYLTTQNSVTKGFILVLNHISTRNCHSEYDVVGTLTPIMQSPSSSKKQKLCYTGDNYFLHLRLRDVFSLAKVLIFNFIHPYASIDPLY